MPPKPATATRTPAPSAKIQAPTTRMAPVIATKTASAPQPLAPPKLAEKRASRRSILQSKGIELPDKDRAGTDKIRRIGEECRKSGSQFTDTEFPAAPSSIWKNPEHRTGFVDDVEIQWKRPREIGNPSEPNAVFATAEGSGNGGAGISPEDIKQGALNNCYFLAALASVANYGELIDGLIDEEYVDAGVYGVKLFAKGQWITVIIDDLFPCYQDPSTGQWVPVFCSYSGEKEIWMMLAEKAWAKFHGSYQVTSNGMTPDTLCYLTGGHRKLFNLDEADTWDNYRDGTLWNTLLRLHAESEKGSRNKGQYSDSQNYVFLCCSGVKDEKQELEVGGDVTDKVQDEGKDPGLVADHAYSILDIRHFPEHGNLKLLKVRNPWGSYEWKYDFSDESPLWTPELKRKVNFVAANDGTFWIRWEDFVDFFSFIGACVVYGKPWVEKSMPVKWTQKENAGGRDDALFRYNPTYRFKNTDPKVIIQIEQDDIRDNARHEQYYFDVFVNIMYKHKHRNYPDVLDTVSGYATATNPPDDLDTFKPFRMHSNSRITTLEMHLPVLTPAIVAANPNHEDYYLITVSLFHPGIVTKNLCSVTVYSGGAFQLEPFKTPEPSSADRSKMVAKALVNPSSPTCCMSGQKIDLSKPGTFIARKGVFWDLESNQGRNFRCAACMRQFDSNPAFFDVGMANDGAWRGYCEPCFKREFYPKCVVCSCAIFDVRECVTCNGSFVRVPEGRIHEDCYIRYQMKHSTSNLVGTLPPKSAGSKEELNGNIPLVVRVKNNPEKIVKLRQYVDAEL